MKKLLVIALAAVTTFALAACTSTTDITANKSGWSNYAEITVKDFQSVGIVQVETKETTSVSPLRFSTKHIGKRTTYADLMAEAKKLGADDIINVRIDARSESSRTRILDFFTGHDDVITYYGTALAIKYTNVSANQPVSVGGTSTLKNVAPASSAGGILTRLPIVGSLFN